jgi:hypothetical protein
MKFEGKKSPTGLHYSLFYLKKMKLISIYLLTSLVSVSHAQVSLDEARSLVGNSSVTHDYPDNPPERFERWQAAVRAAAQLTSVLASFQSKIKL